MTVQELIVALQQLELPHARVIAEVAIGDDVLLGTHVSEVSRDRFHSTVTITGKRENPPKPRRAVA